MADALKSELDLEPEIVPGAVGEFSIWVGDRRVHRKWWFLPFPRPERVVRAVRQALGRTTP